MKKIVFFGFFICHVFSLVAQEIDTISIICQNFAPVDKQYHKRMHSFSIKQGTIYLEKCHNMDTTIIRNEERINSGNYYCKFFDGKHRIIEEGRWCSEYFNGAYISYYKNGNIKKKGSYQLGNCVGEWTYYKRNGCVKKIVQYPF